MKDNEIQAFTNGLNVLREVWGLNPLTPVAVQGYWDRLKQFTAAQFTQACRKLMDKSAGDYKRQFPLPGDFLEAMAPEPEEYRMRWPDQIPEGPTAHIIKRILPLMPPTGKFNNEEQARAMVKRMNEIVDEEFAKQKGLAFSSQDR
jgi:hypothetical protein